MNIIEKTGSTLRTLSELVSDLKHIQGEEELNHLLKARGAPTIREFELMFTELAKLYPGELFDQEPVYTLTIRQRSGVGELEGSVQVNNRLGLHVTNPEGVITVGGLLEKLYKLAFHQRGKMAMNTHPDGDKK